MSFDLDMTVEAPIRVEPPPKPLAAATSGNAHASMWLRRRERLVQSLLGKSLEELTDQQPPPRIVAIKEAVDMLTWDLSDTRYIANITSTVFHSRASGSSRRARDACLLYTSPSPRDATLSRMPSSA